MGQVQEQCKNVLHSFVCWDEREFVLIKWDSLVSSVWTYGFQWLLHDCPDMDSGGEALLPPKRVLWTPTPVLLYRVLQHEEQELYPPTDLKQVLRPTNHFTLYGSANTA